MKAAKDSADDEAGSHSYAPTAIASVASRVTVNSAGDFCEFALNIAFHAKESGCTVLAASGVIPFVFALIARHITVKNVVLAGCRALFQLAFYGGARVKQALIDVPECETILKDAQASGLDKKPYGDRSSVAANLLKALGL